MLCGFALSPCRNTRNRPARSTTATDVFAPHTWLAVSAIEHVRRALQQSSLAGTGLEFAAGGGVAVAGPASDWSTARLTDAAVPAPWLAVVRLRDARGRRRTAIVLPDNLPPEAFRRLRVWLLWRPAGVVEERGANNPTRR